jgi:hypothetical protein
MEALGGSGFTSLSLDQKEELWAAVKRSDG